ncbi:hypothetical protein QYM36_006687 [Artemia franciscana]|uniref:Nucleotide-sugar transporter n=1 Tax=Artemia franciscana TaxID=6661 RepID=A0AA88L9L4_ARTSF|nr:hypothetical protein QYM36_006687 [Artemia franciscana]
MKRQSKTVSEESIVLTAYAMNLFLLFSIALSYDNWNAKAVFKTIYTECSQNYLRLAMLLIPAAQVTLQTKLKLFALSRIDAPIFDLTSQLKIVTTGLFSLFILKHRLRLVQWVSILLLLLGVSLIHFGGNPRRFLELDEPTAEGLIAVACICIISGLSAALCEKLNQNVRNIWTSNMLINLMGLLLSFFIRSMTILSRMIGKDSNPTGDKPEMRFFEGFDTYVWGVIIIGNISSLLVVLILKEGDSILKCFSNSSSIIFTCLISICFFSTELTKEKMGGALIIIFSLLLYSFDSYRDSRASKAKERYQGEDKRKEKGD